MKLPEPYRKLARAAREAGWTVTLTPGGHLSWQPPEGPAVITASTPSDWRGVRNGKARLRAAGLAAGGT